MAILHAVVRYFHTPSPQHAHRTSIHEQYSRKKAAILESFSLVIFTNHVPHRLALSHYLGAKEKGFFAAGLPI